LSRTIDVPPEYEVIRDAMVTQALGEGTPPEDDEKLQDFQDWLFYEAGSSETDDDFELVVRHNHFDFHDDQMRWKLELPDEAPISDQQRLEYARKVIDTYGNDSEDYPHFAQVIGLRRTDGKTVFFGYLSELGGQGGMYPECYGSFADLESFLSELRKTGWWVLKDGANKIPDQVILKLWSQTDRDSSS
jgi:hypothetical protein